MKRLGRRRGRTFLIYSDFGWGKTTAFLTLPGRTRLYITEPRDVREVIGEPESIDIFIPETHDDLMEDLNKQLGLAENEALSYQNICLDSASFLMSTYKLDTEDARLEARAPAKEREEYMANLANRYVMIDADWGKMSSMMKRLTALFNKFSQWGLNVVFTATEVENPKFDLTVKYAPGFLGKEYPSHLNGYFDFIGRIVKKWEIIKDESGSVVKINPPIVSFVAPNGEYVAKCCNRELAIKERGPLDFGKILGIIEGNQ